MTKEKNVEGLAALYHKYRELIETAVEFERMREPVPRELVRQIDTVDRRIAKMEWKKY